MSEPTCREAVPRPAGSSSSAPMGMTSPQDGEQLTKIELSTAKATAATELALEALKNRDWGELEGP